MEATQETKLNSKQLIEQKELKFRSYLLKLLNNKETRKIGEELQKIVFECTSPLLFSDKTINEQKRWIKQKQVKR